MSHIIIRLMEHTWKVTFGSKTEVTTVGAGGRDETTEPNVNTASKLAEFKSCILDDGVFGGLV